MCVLPRWAPDLGRGTGQPLFLFHPPMIYYFGEFWHLLGFDFVTAMNLACAAVVLLSAAAMFLLARLYFGDAGGWLGAAAYLYVPYFAVDLYVRSAMEEFAAFPFFALALYGFGAYAKRRTRRHWLIGVAAYACVLFCHFPAALLFTPLLLGFLGSDGMDGEIVERAVEAGMRFPSGAGVERVHLGAGAGGAPACGHEPRGGGVRPVRQPFCVSAPAVLLPVGLRAFAARTRRWHVVRAGVEPSAAGGVVWIWISRRPKLGDRRLLRFFGAAALVLCILTLQDALWFWEQVPLLQNVQLPWRLLGPVAICMALVIAQLGRLLSRAPRWRALGIGGGDGAVDRSQSVASAFQTAGGCRSYFLDAPATLDARIRDHHHGGGDAALDDGAAPVHSGCGHGAFGRRGDTARDVRRSPGRVR